MAGKHSTKPRLHLVSEPALRCAVYARKSTDDSERNEENRSTTRQIEHAKAYAKSHGWIVDDDHVYVDDNVSGSEFVNRPGLLRMLNNLAQFDIIIMSELSRLGREQYETGTALASIAAKRVRIWFYLDDKELKFESAVDKFMVTAISFGAELEREKASQRSRDALERKWRNGYVSGGLTYGYDNLVVNGANGERDHSEYRINEGQADTLRRIFKMYAAGYGMVVISKTLNRDSRYKKLSRKFFNGRIPPSPTKGSGSWPASTIRAMLVNQRYLGRIPFGQYKKIYLGGTRKRIKVGEPSYTESPDLRIIDDELWESVHKRLRAIRKTYAREEHGKHGWQGRSGTLFARPDTGRASKSLLSGLAYCSRCGSNMIAWRSTFTSGSKLVPHYRCSYNSNRGNAICSNNTRERQVVMDERVLNAIERSILTPDAIHFVLQNALELVEQQRKSEPDPSRRIEADIKRLTRERDNLVNLAAQGKAPSSVLEEITKRERAIAALEAELVPHRLKFEDKDIATLKAGMIERMAKFHQLLHSEVALSRQALRKLLVGRIKCIPVVRDGKKGFAVRGETQLGALVPRDCVKRTSPSGHHNIGFRCAK
jgi:site-specific DNA recombinase